MFLRAGSAGAFPPHPDGGQDLQRPEGKAQVNGLSSGGVDLPLDNPLRHRGSAPSEKGVEGGGGGGGGGGAAAEGGAVKLERRVGLFSGIALIIGTMIGEWWGNGAHHRHHDR